MAMALTSAMQRQQEVVRTVGTRTQGSSEAAAATQRQLTAASQERGAGLPARPSFQEKLAIRVFT